MPSIYKTALSVRVFGDDLDPDEISCLLGAVPTTSRRKGEVRKTPKGGEVIARKGSWSLKAKDRSPGDLSAQIVDVLSRLTNDLSVWVALRKRYDCDVFCGIFMEEDNEGEMITDKAMAMMSERGLKLQLDIYARFRED